MTINMTEGVMNIFKAWVDESGFDIDESSLSNLNQKVSEMLSVEQKKQSKSSKKAKSIKDPDAPKRGKSAYIFFCNANREVVKSELGDELKTTEITKELGARWNKLKESTKASDKKLVATYEEQAKQDKDRYDGEMQGYDRPSDEELEEKLGKKGSKKTKKTKDPSAPKRGKSAYIFFCGDKREEVKNDLGAEAKATDITKELGVRWNMLKESTKASDKKLLTKYEKMATDDKDRYEKEKSDSSSSDDDSVKAKKTKKPTVKKAAKKEVEVEEDEDSLEEEDE